MFHMGYCKEFATVGSDLCEKEGRLRERIIKGLPFVKTKRLKI